MSRGSDSEFLILARDNGRRIHLSNARVLTEAHSLEEIAEFLDEKTGRKRRERDRDRVDRDSERGLFEFDLRLGGDR